MRNQKPTPVEIVSEDEIYLIDEKTGERKKRICGHQLEKKPKGVLCTRMAGHGTPFLGVGKCARHRTEAEAAETFMKICKEFAEGTTLEKILEKSYMFNSELEDVSIEVALLNSFLLWTIQYVREQENGVFDASHIKFMQDIIKDITRTKAEGARIKGSTKLSQVTIESFVDQIMSFLVRELKMLLGREDVVALLLKKMFREVFAPMAAQGIVEGKVPDYAEVPEGISFYAGQLKGKKNAD